MYLNTTAVDIQFSHGIDFERDLFQKTYPIVKSFQIARPPSEGIIETIHVCLML